MSTPSNLVRFGLAINGGTLLQRETVEQLQTPQRLSSGDSTGYGLGWDLESMRLGDDRASRPCAPLLNREAVEEPVPAGLHERGLTASGRGVHGIPRHVRATKAIVMADDGAFGVGAARPVVARERRRRAQGNDYSSAPGLQNNYTVVPDSP